MSTVAPAGVSVVVCCHNSAERLPATLRRIALQDVPGEVPWEVVVVDNASTDGTAQVARREWERHDVEVPFRVVAEPTPGLVVARDKGFAEARYAFVLFCDDDNWLDADYIRIVHEVMSDRAEVGVLGGRGEPAFDEPPPEWFSAYEHYYAVGSQGEASGDVTDDKGYVYGAGFAVRNSAWQRIREQGYESPLREFVRGSNDLEVCYLVRLAGFRIWYDERLRFQHHIPPRRLDWEYFLRLTETAHRSGVYIAPYRHVFESHERRGEYVRPSEWHWMTRSFQIVQKGLRRRLAALKNAKRTDEVKERRLRGELSGWSTLRGSYPKLCDRIEALRQNLHSSSSAEAS